MSQRSPFRATRAQNFRVTNDRSEMYRHGRDAGGEEMNNPKWVIMVYIAADDTLANFAIESLKQLKDTATDEVVVVAQFDPDGLSTRHKVRRYVFDQTTRDKRLQNDDKALWAGESRDVVMTDPQTLTSFMNWAYRKYGEASNYSLFLWGHAAYELLFE